MIIPFVENCMLCNLGGYTDYEYVHGASEEELDNLAHHTRVRALGAPIYHQNEYQTFRHLHFQEPT